MNISTCTCILFSWQNAYDATSGFRHLLNYDEPAYKMDWPSASLTLSDISRTVCVFLERATIFLLQFSKWSVTCHVRNPESKHFELSLRGRKNNVNRQTVTEFRFNSISIKPCIMTSENTTFMFVCREHTCKHSEIIQ